MHSSNAAPCFCSRTRLSSSRRCAALGGLQHRALRAGAEARCSHPPAKVSGAWWPTARGPALAPETRASPLYGCPVPAAEAPDAGQPATCVTISPPQRADPLGAGRALSLLMPGPEQEQGCRRRPQVPAGSQLWKDALQGSLALGDVCPPEDRTVRGRGLGRKGLTPSSVR